MNMNLSELINEIISEWAYRVDDGMPNPKNPTHVNELGLILSEMGLSHIKNTLIENLLNETGTTPQEVDEAEEGSFKNPILNKVIKYKNTKGEEADGVVGNLLRLPAEHPGRKAAEALLPPEGSGEREKMNQDLGGQNQAAKPDGGGEKKDGEGEDGGADDAEQKKQQAAMFTSDPAMVARIDREKETLAKLAQKDKEASDKKAELDKKEEPNPLDAKFNPIEAQDVPLEMPKADPETFGGSSDIPDGIAPSDLEEFNTDIKKVAKQVSDAKAKGEKAPDINLCDVTVPGTNLYCDDNLGIPRSEMPQFKGKATPGSRADGMPVDKDGEVDTEPIFKKMLEEKGIKVVQTEVPSDKLKATQKDLVGAKVVGMMGALEEDPNHEKITAPIYVSRDGFVIDGHHRWAAITAYNAQHPENQIPMKVQVIDKDIKDAIPMCNQFAEDMGIAAKKADANKEDSTKSNVKTFKGESSGKEIKTVELEGGGFLFGTQHGDTKMADDIINQVKQRVPKEKWKDIVFVGEGGATGDSGELEFNDEMEYSAPKFKEMGASIDTWDGDELDVHNDQSDLYKSQEEQTGLSQNKIKAGNWASMIGQGEGTDTMSPNDFLDDDGKQFLQAAAKEAGLPPIENWDNPTGESPSDENPEGSGDKGTLYRLSFPEDNGDTETGVNTVQVAFNKARDLNLIKKQKQLAASGKIPVVMAGESHADLVDDIMKGNKADVNNKNATSPTPDINKNAPMAIQKIKDGVKNWSIEEKEFFKKKIHNGNSPERRTFSESFKDKAKGAWESIKHGAKHEVHTFKEAGTGVKNFFSGGKVSESEKKALIEVAKKVAIAAAFGAAGGGLAHGAAAFGKHLMVEFVPHVVAETVLMGAGKAALFAGDTDSDEDMTKFMEIISKKLESADIPEEIMASAVESYNENKPKKEMKEENLQLAHELMLEMIYGFINEAKPNAKVQSILNQRIKYKEDGTDHNVKVSTAIQYKNSEKPGQRKAYKDALQLFKKAGVAIPDAGATKKPVGKTIAPTEFRPTPDMKKKPTKAAPKVKPTPRSETNNPHKKNGNEGETILELKPEEIDSILEKYVNAGEKTPDDMRELTPDYSNQDMAKGYSDKDFYSKAHKEALAKQKIKVRSKPYKMDDASKQNLRDSGFPEKYIKFLERCINTQVNGKKPAVTELIKQGGAGQIQSQFGEVMAMAFMSIRDPNVRRQMADVLNSEIAKSAQEFGGDKASPIATKDWVEASLTHAEAFDSAMDEKYGKGKWRFEGAAWDIKGDIETLGLDYKNKGFSTDVMLRVQPLDKNGNPNGPAKAQKNSLKKDENIFFFNGSINEVNNFVLNFVDDAERKRVRGYEAIATKAGASNKNVDDRKAAIAAAERITGLKGGKAVAALKQMAGDIRDKAFNAAPKHVQQAVSKVRNFGAAQTKSAETLINSANTDIKTPNDVIANAKNIDSGDKDFAKFSYKAVKDCKASGTEDMTTCIRQKLSKAGEKTTDDKVCKVAVMATKVAAAAGDVAAEKALSKHYSLAVEAGNALMNVLPESEQLMGGLMQKLADAFPMKTCMEGEEFMCIDGMKVTQKTLQTVFGVASYDELQKGMQLKRLPTGETILVYGAKDKNGKDIPIGVVGARQKGKGYEGTVGFEISCSDDFALAIAEANNKNGDTSTSNEKARQSIGKRVGGREAKAGKKK
jgi:hypothetical protein